MALHPNQHFWVCLLVVLAILFLHLSITTTYQSLLHSRTEGDQVEALATDSIAQKQHNLLGDWDSLTFGQLKKVKRRSNTSFLQHAGLLKRQDQPSASQADYDKAIRRGNSLKCLLQMTEAEATAALLVNGKIKPGETSASRWTGQEQLIQHGWVRTPTAGIAAPDIANVYEIRPAMDALELEDGRPVPYVKWKHQNPATVNGVDYQATWTEYYASYDARHGTIYATHSYGLAYFRDSGFLSTPIINEIPCKQWADIAFIEWQTLSAAAGRPVRGLKYVFRLNVVSENTVPIMQTVLLSVGSSLATLPEWPGINLATSGDAGKALLGSDNGNGVAWLLIRHKALMELKDISTITLFLSEAGTYCMVLRIEDYPPQAVKSGQ